MSDDRKARLVELDVHRRKLAALVGELLSKADEIDQNSKLIGRTLSNDWHERMAHACQDLSRLSTAVSELEVLQKAGKVDALEEAIARSIDIARHLSSRLKELKSEAAPYS